MLYTRKNNVPEIADLLRYWPMSIYLIFGGKESVIDYLMLGDILFFFSLYYTSIYNLYDLVRNQTDNNEGMIIYTYT